MPYKLFCFIPGDKCEFPVDIDETQTVGDLKKKIKEEKALKLNDASKLTLYKVNVDISSQDTRRTILKAISNNTYGFDPQKEELAPSWKISEYFEKDSDKTIDVLVELPPDEQADDPSPPKMVDDSLRQHVTFQLQSPKTYTPDDLVYNKISALSGTEPDYVMRFKEKLIRKRIVKNTEVEALNRLRLYSPQLIDNCFNVESAIPTDIGLSDPYQVVTRSEISHYGYIFQQPILHDQNHFNQNKEAHVFVLLYILRYFVDGIDASKNSFLKFNGNWNFFLIPEVAGEKSQYTPRSDALLCINLFPHLILEVMSDGAHSDRNRMFLQAACLARLGNALRQDLAVSDPFICSAIYIDEELCATWYLVYQPHAPHPAVEYVKERFDLTTGKRAFDLLFRLFNFVSMAKEDNGTLRNTLQNVSMLHANVNQMKLPSLTSLKRKRGDDDPGNGSSKKQKDEGRLVGSDILSNVAVLDALERAGYTIPGEVEGFKSLLPLTAKMLRAVSAQGEKVILKLTDEHEVEVLRRLHGNHSKRQTRIIPLLDVIGGRVMVLPLRMPLTHFLPLDASGDDVEQLALQFLEGVVYLQHSSVAHLDLKPDNIVVRRDPVSKKVDLSIIDFNIAVFADAEPTITGSSGTSGYCAPEVSAGKPYDPLLADRWSCGRVLADFTGRMKQGRLRSEMHSLSQRLMNPNPSLRPPVLDALCPQEMGGVLDPSIRFPVSRPGGAPRPSRGHPRSSRRLKGLGPQDHTSLLVAKMRTNWTPKPKRLHGCLDRQEGAKYQV